MAAAIRLEDLLKAQAKLKEDEAKKQTTETMSVEEFRKMASEMSDTTPGTTTKSLIKKGLTDKTGEGLNANVIKLTKVIKDTTSKKGNIVGAAGATIAAPADRTAQASQDVDQARRARLEDQAGKYQKGGLGYLKEQFKVPVDLKGMQAFKAGFKNMFKLENMFDLSEGQSQGFLGQIIRRKVAKNKYVEGRMESEQGRMLNLPQYQGKEGRARAEKDLRNQFERQQDTAAQVVEHNKERQRLQDMVAAGNDTPAIRKKLAALEGAETGLDKKVAKDDPAYRARMKAEQPDRAVPVESTKPVLTKVSPLEAATQNAEKARIDETEAETNRVIGDQTATLNQIEENTRTLKDLPNQLAKLAVPAAAAGAAAEADNGLGIGDMLDVGKRGLGRLGGAVKRVGGSWLGKVGGGAKLVKGLGIGAVAGLAGEGLQMGGESLKEAGYEQTGKAVGVAGTATKYAGYGAMIGSVIPGVGTAVGAGIGGLIGAGKGIYDQYFSGDKAKPVEKASVTREYEVSGVTSDDIRNHPNYQNYYEKALNGRTGPDAERMARKSAAMKVTADIAKARAEQPTQAAATATPTAAVAPKAADQVYQQSGDNAQAARKGPELGAAPVIVNAPTNVQNNTQAAPRPPARNTESSWQQYNRSKYAMA